MPARAGSSPPRTVRHALHAGLAQVDQAQHSPEQLLDVTLQPIMFVVLFVFLFGGAIAGSTGTSTCQYVLPGMMAQTVMFASMGTGVKPERRHRKGVFDRFRSLPIARSAPLIGAVVGDFSGTVVTCRWCWPSASLLGFRIQTNAVSVARPRSAWSFAFSCALLGSVLLGLLVPTPDDGAGRRLPGRCSR